MVNQVLWIDIFREAFVKFIIYCIFSLFNYSLMRNTDNDYQKLKKQYDQLTHKVIVVNEDFSQMDLPKVIQAMNYAFGFNLAPTASTNEITTSVYNYKEVDKPAKLDNFICKYIELIINDDTYREEQENLKKKLKDVKSRIRYQAFARTLLVYIITFVIIILTLI